MLTLKETREKKRLRGQAAALGTAVVLLFGGLVFQLRNVARLDDQVSRLSTENTQRDADVKKLRGLLDEKEKALTLATRQNYQQDLILVQDALKEANQKMAVMIREKAAVENSGYAMDNRLKNTTQELTRTLEELKKTREALAGVDNQYKTKLNMATQNLKFKEEQYAKLAQRLKGEQEAAVSLKGQGKDYPDSVRRFQKRISELEADVEDLNRTIQENDRALAQKQDSLDQARRTAAQGSARPVSDARVSERLSALEREKADLEGQVSDARATILDREEELTDLRERIRTLTRAASERDDLLAKIEGQVADLQEERDALNRHIEELRAGTMSAASSSAEVAATRINLEKKIRQLEEDKRKLEARLATAEKRRGPAEPGEPVVDIFADRNFKILTENLVKKEEEIKDLSARLAALTAEKRSWESGAGNAQQRLTELGILVNSLTKQLGEYAGLLEKKDGELKASSRKINELTDAIEAEKVASIAMQKELEQARARQEKTFQTLTQIMGLNAGGGPAISPPETPAPDSGRSASYLTPEAGAGDAKKRAEELKRRVEVLLESRP